MIDPFLSMIFGIFLPWPVHTSAGCGFLRCGLFVVLILCPIRYPFFPRLWAFWMSWSLSCWLAVWYLVLSLVSTSGWIRSLSFSMSLRVRHSFMHCWMSVSGTGMPWVTDLCGGSMLRECSMVLLVRGNTFMVWLGSIWLMVSPMSIPITSPWVSWMFLVVPVMCVLTGW